MCQYLRWKMNVGMIFHLFLCFFWVQTPLSFSQPTFDVFYSKILSFAPTTIAPEQIVMFSSFESFSSQCKTPWATMPARHVYISKQQTSFGPFYALTSDFCSLFPLTSVAQWQSRRCGETVPFAPALFSPGGAEEKHSSQQQRLWWPFKWPQWHHRPLCTQGVTLLNGSYLGWVHRLWYNFKRMGTL